MTWSANACVVVPCLNEAGQIGSVVSAARQFLPAVFVVDDGSSDLTSGEAIEAGASAIRHPQPRGKGEALRSGFTAALRSGYTWALAMDGDGQHAAADIPKFLAEAEQGGRMIIGNRMLNPAAMPRLRRVVNRWMSQRLSELCGVQIPDSQCGFRFVHLPSWNSLRFTARRFEVESELAVRFAAARLPIRSVPIQTCYGQERSKIRPLRDTVRWFRWLAAIERELGRPALAWPGARLSHDSV